MSKVEDAARRLERAVERLEDACRRIEAKSPGSDQLALELAQAKRDYAQLAEATGKVANRLDGAIERLNTVLES
jgi:phage shock protein A